MKCFESKLSENFQNVFTIRAYEQNTRNNGFMLETPQVKLKVTKSNSPSMGVTIYNDLPIINLRTDSFVIFKELLRKHFKSQLTIFHWFLYIGL